MLRCASGEYMAIMQERTKPPGNLIRALPSRNCTFRHPEMDVSLCTYLEDGVEEDRRWRWCCRGGRREASATWTSGRAACTSRGGRASAFFRSNCCCFSANRRCVINWECLRNFMFRYCCDRMAVAGGKAESVLSISSASVMTWPHNMSCATMRWSSEL